MKSPTDPFKNRSPDEAIQWFIKESTIDLTSQASRDFFKTFAEHTRSPTLSPEQKDSAQAKLSALQQIYSVQFETSLRATEKDKETLSPPSGLALTPEGNLVVADDFNHRIQIYDKDHKLIAQFGSKGKNPGELLYPKGLALDPEGNIYVADSWNHRVQKFDCRGKHLATFGGYGSESGQLNEPYDVHIDAMRQVIVVERYNHRVQVFSPDGASLGWIGTRGTLLEEKLAYLFETPSTLFSSPAFEFPTSIACDSQHHYYITDSGNHRIVKFTPEWKQAQTIGEQGDGPGQFQYPLCVAVGPNDLLYVTDLNNDRIQVFTSQGQFLFAFASAKTPLKMPCLAKVSAQNRLYLGLTFNAEIPVFQVPAISLEALYERQIQIRPDDFRSFFCQGKLYQDSGAIDMAANSYASGLSLLLEQKAPLSAEDTSALLQFARLPGRHSKDNALLLKCLDLFDSHMETIHKKTQAIHREWNTAAVDFGERLVRKENALLEQKSEPKTFDKELYLAEKKDKALYRESRILFHDYRKASDIYAEFIGLLIKNPGKDREPCGNNLRKRLERVCGLINDYFDVKEKNEETMIRFFAEAPDSREKWEDFRSKSPANGRIMYLLKQFHYELRTILRAIKGVALECPSAPWVRELFGKTFISPQNCHPLLKILLRNHECFYEVDTLLKDLIDTWINWDIASYPVVTLKADDLAPIPYDIEDIRTEDLLLSLLIEGMPLKQTKEGVICGDKIYRFGGENSGELAARMEAIYKNQAVYEEKSADLYNQLIVLQKQRLALELQSRQADARDKTALIPINKNIYITDFQADLTIRMQIALDFNEINNLVRLLLCGALLVTSVNGNAATPPIFKTIRDHTGTLESKINIILEERKKLYYERAATDRALEQMSQNLSACTLEQSLNMKKQLTQLQQDYNRSEIVYSHHIRVKNILGKLLRFVDGVYAQPVEKNRTLKLKYTFGLGGPVAGRFISPLGIAHTPEGDILVSDVGSDRILRFSPQGSYRSEFGGWGSLFGLIKYPNNVATDSTGCIYVADTNNGRIQKFTKDGEFILAFGDRGDEKIGACFSLSIDRENNVWAVNMQNHRIQIYDADGNQIRFVGRPGKNPEEIFEPTSVCCLDNGDYIVGDQSGFSLKRFDAQGNLLHVLKKDGRTFDAIFFITSHPVHGIFATDTWRDRILHLDSELRIISVHDQGGRRGGQFSKISGLSIKGNTLAVANLDAHRIHVFELPNPAK